MNFVAYISIYFDYMLHSAACQEGYYKNSVPGSEPCSTCPNSPMQTVTEVMGLFIVSVIGATIVINRFLKTSIEMEASAKRLLQNQGAGSSNRLSAMFSDSEHMVVSNVIVRLILNQTQILGLILKFNLKWPEAVVMVFDGTDNVLR